MVVVRKVEHATTRPAHACAGGWNRSTVHNGCFQTPNRHSCRRKRCSCRGQSASRGRKPLGLYEDQFGNIVDDSGPGDITSRDVFFADTGRLYDSETGLQNNLNRWYRPDVGRRRERHVWRVRFPSPPHPVRSLTKYQSWTHTGPRSNLATSWEDIAKEDSAQLSGKPATLFSPTRDDEVRDAAE
jgi:hypothetical protein